jgi:hypothetical protein
VAEVFTGIYLEVSLRFGSTLLIILLTIVGVFVTSVEIILCKLEDNL